jgi:hypothetical protein
LYNNNPDSVVDVGCGECIWKKWFPNIIGFDPNTNEFSQHDFVDFFDEDFSAGHEKNYDCGMALNSLHYIDWSYVPTQLDLAMNIVKDQFLFTFNFDQVKNKPTEILSELILLFDQVLESSKYKIALVDYPALRDQDRTRITSVPLHGHARFILQH